MQTLKLHYVWFGELPFDLASKHGKAFRVGPATAAFHTLDRPDVEVILWVSDGKVDAAKAAFAPENSGLPQALGEKIRFMDMSDVLVGL